jgi:hypothetical protein
LDPAEGFEVLFFDIATKWRLGDGSWRVLRDGAGAGLQWLGSSLPPGASWTGAPICWKS